MANDDDDNITAAPSSSSFSLASPPSSAIQTKPSFSLDLDLHTTKPKWLSVSAQVWEYIKIYLRFGLLCLSVAVIVCVLTYEYSQRRDMERFLYAVPVWPCSIPAVAAVFYDMGELVVRFVRHGRGIPAKALIGCELVALLGSLAGIAVFIWQAVSWGYTMEWLGSSNLGLTFAVGAMGCLSAIIRLILWVRACIDRGRELAAGKPRVMYIPSTGEVVYLVPRPRRSRELDMFDEIKETLRKETAVSDADTARHEKENHAPPLRPRPVARRPTGLMNPPPDDYEPDEAELERRRRGDAQPQLILLPGDTALKFSSNIGGSTPGGSYAVEGKVLGRPNWADSDSLRSSEVPRRRSWG